MENWQSTMAIVEGLRMKGKTMKDDDADGTKKQKGKGKMIDATKLGSWNEISARDFDVLEHIARYRVGTLQSLKSTVFYGKSINVVGKVTRRLVRQGWLAQHQAGPFFFVYTLSRKTCCLLDLPVELAPKAMSGDALVADYGVLEYCCVERQDRNRLTRDELREAYTSFYSADLDGGRFLWDGGFRPAKLGLMWVDRCGDLEAFIAECRKEWEARWASTSVRDAVGRSGLRLVLLTGTEERALILRRLVGTMAWPAKVPVAVEVVPRLLQLYLRLEPFARSSGKGTGELRDGARFRVESPSSRRPVQFSKLVRRDYDILRHIARYRVATLASLKEAFFKGKSRSLVSLVCARLVRNGWIRRHPLGIRGCYYALSPQSAFLLGDRALAVDEPLNPKEIARELCLVRHCFDFRKGRVRLTKADLEEKYPFCIGTEQEHDAFCLDSGTTVERLEMVSLDHERTTEQTVNECREVVQSLVLRDPVRKQASRHGFQVFVYSGCKRRADVLRREFAQQSWGRGVTVTVEVLPELLQFASIGHEQGEEKAVDCRL